VIDYVGLFTVAKQPTGMLIGVVVREMPTLEDVEQPIGQGTVMEYQAMPYQPEVDRVEVDQAMQKQIWHSYPSLIIYLTDHHLSMKVILIEYDVGCVESMVFKETK